MRKVWSFALLSLALFSLPSRARAEDDEATTLQKRDKALRYSFKTTDPGSPIDTGGAAIFVNAKLADVRKVVTDYRHYDEFIKPFKQSRLLSRRKGVSELYLEVPVMNGAATIWTVVHASPPEKDGVGEKIVARYSRGNVDDFRAVWRLRPVDDTHTIVKLELLVDPKLPLPASMVTPELQYAADKAVTAVRDRAENRKAQSAPPPLAQGATPSSTTVGAAEQAPNVAKR